MNTLYLQIFKYFMYTSCCRYQILKVTKSGLSKNAKNWFNKEANRLSNANVSRYEHYAIRGSKPSNELHCLLAAPEPSINQSLIVFRL